MKTSPTLVVLMLSGMAAAGYHGDTIFPTITTAASKTLRTGCTIKGNISQNTGEFIYHVPGQEHYQETVIRTEYGERWFCSEQEAVAAGWRRARN